MSTATATYASTLAAIKAAGLGAKINIFNNGEAPLGTNGSDYAVLLQKLAAAGWDAVCGDSVAGDVVNTVRKNLPFVNHAGNIGGYQLSAYQDPWSHPVDGTFPHSDYIYTSAAPDTLSRSAYITKDSVVFGIHQAYEAGAESLGIVISDQAPGDINTWIDVINSAQNSPVIDTIVLAVDKYTDIIEVAMEGVHAEILQALQAVYTPNTPVVPPPPPGATATVTTVTTSSATPNVGVSFTLSGTLKTGGVGLVSKTITINRLDPTGAWSIVDTPATDSGGNFASTESEPTAGAYTFQAVFGGDATYATSNAQVNITVGTPPPTCPAQGTVITTGSHPGAAASGSQIRVFGRGSNDELYTVTYNGSTWGNWGSLGGTIVSAPAACSMSSGNYAVFTRGTNSAVYTIWLQNGSWSAWYDAGGGTYYGPGCASWGSNDIFAFAVGTTGALYYVQYYPSSGWSAWRSLSGACYSDPSVCSCGSLNVHAFVRGSTGQVYQCQTGNGSSWTWQALGGPVMMSGTGPSACCSGSVYHVFVVNSNTVYHMSYSGAWSGWENLCGVATSSPASCVTADGHVHVFVRGNEQAVWHREYNGSTWAAWASIGGQLL